MIMKFSWILNPNYLGSTLQMSNSEGKSQFLLDKQDFQS